MTPCIRRSPPAQPSTAIPEPFNMERGRESYAQSIALPPKLQHPLEHPSATDIPFSRHDPQSSTPNLSPFPESDTEHVASPAKTHQRPGPGTRVSNESHHDNPSYSSMLHHQLPPPPPAMKACESAPRRRGLSLGDGEPPPGIQKLLSEIENDFCASFCRCLCSCLCCWCCCGDS